MLPKRSTTLPRPPASVASGVGNAVGTATNGAVDPSNTVTTVNKVVDGVGSGVANAGSQAVNGVTGAGTGTVQKVGSVLTGGSGTAPPSSSGSSTSSGSNPAAPATSGLLRRRQRHGHLGLSHQARSRGTASAREPCLCDTGEVFGAWRSLVARTVRVGEVPGSNPGAPISLHHRAAVRAPARGDRHIHGLGPLRHEGKLAHPSFAQPVTPQPMSRQELLQRPVAHLAAMSAACAANAVLSASAMARCDRLRSSCQRTTSPTRSRHSRISSAGSATPCRRRASALALPR